MFNAFPADLRRQLIDKHVSPERLLTGMREGANLQALFEELRAGAPVPDVPLIVLSGAAVGAEMTLFQSEEDARQRIAGSQRLFDAIAAGNTHGEHRILSDASHVSIPMVRSDAVADAVRDLLSRIELGGLRRLAERGNTDAADQLVELATERGDMDELRRLADRGNRTAVDQLIELAGERGDTDELRRLADQGHSDAADQLIELATERGDLDELRRLAAKGNNTAAEQLAELVGE